MITDGAQLRFLVVDDDADIRDLLVRVIERLGHSADRASDGADAVQCLAVEKYDFMLLDLTMPRMSGADVLAWLRDHPQFADGLRVVVVSARVEELDSRGVHAVLPKPVRVQQLRELVAAHAAPDGAEGQAS